MNDDSWAHLPNPHGDLFTPRSPVEAMWNESRWYMGSLLVEERLSLKDAERLTGATLDDR